MYQHATLANGLRIICEYIPHAQSVSLGLWVGSGSRYEDPKYNGISHFVEHMLFKGTSKRNAKQIAETIDAVGGQLNAFTTKEYTCYYAKVLSQHYALGIDLLTEMLTDSLFEPVEIQKEQSVVLEEIKSFEDSPDELIHDLLAEALLNGHPLGRTILGTPASMCRIDRAILLEYLKEHYTPDNIVFAVAGNVQFDQVLPEIEQRLEGLVGKWQPDLPAITVCESKYLLKTKPIEQIHLCLGARGLNRNNPDKYGVFVLDSILGGSVSSRLFQKLREECGLVYTTGSNHSAHLDTGIFSIYAATGMKNLQAVADLIKMELQVIQDQLVGAAELNRAKEQLKGNLLLSLENTSNRMSRIAKAELFQDKLLTPAESVAKIDLVTSDDLLRIARAIFGQQRPVLAAIGPFKHRDKMIKRIYDEF